MAPMEPECDVAMRAGLEQLRHPEQPNSVSDRLCAHNLPSHLGLNDGTIYPPDHFPEGTSLQLIQGAALNKQPLSGLVNVMCVLVDFPDRPFSTADVKPHFEELLFGILSQHGSAYEYYKTCSNDQISVTGRVVGPYTMPQPVTYYAAGASGTAAAQPNIQTLGQHAAEAVNADLKSGKNLARYDNNGDGFMDAFIVVHAGPGAEELSNSRDRANSIWSLKWVLPGGAYTLRDNVKVYSFLTLPETAQLGVCVHELGHLVFGWPDLYDQDNTSSGLGNWCVMAGGSWNRTVESGPPGSLPCEPSAWCKQQQGWVEVVQVSSAGMLTIRCAEADPGERQVFRIDINGSGSEYFLIENRQQKGWDAGLPGSGLLIFHVDETVANNNSEWRPKVMLEQADGKWDLNYARNRGDDGDPYRGAVNPPLVLSDDTNPSTRSYYGNRRSGITLRNFSPSGDVMTCEVSFALVQPPPLAAPALGAAAELVQPMAAVQALPAAVQALPGLSGAVMAAPGIQLAPGVMPGQVGMHTVAAAAAGGPQRQRAAATRSELQLLRSQLMLQQRGRRSGGGAAAAAGSGSRGGGAETAARADRVLQLLLEQQRINTELMAELVLMRGGQHSTV